MRSLILIFAVTGVLLFTILFLIFLNRGSDNIYGLTIKVLSPLLVSLSLLIWELTSKDKRYEESFYTIGLYFKDDGFPINLGSVYYTTFNKGVCYSAFTSAYKSTNYKNALSEYLESRHPVEEFEEEGVKKNRKIQNYTGTTNDIGEFSINLTAIAYLQGFLRREYKFEWDKSKVDVNWLGGGMGITPINQGDLETNSEIIVLGNLVSDLKLNLNESLRDYQFYIPKDGSIKVELDDKAQFKSFSVIYNSPRIKEYRVKFNVERYSHVFQGKVADALEKELDINKIFATYYKVNVKYSTNWYNRFSPKTNREISWINHQIELMKKYFSWDEIENDIVYAINNYNKEKNRFDLDAKEQDRPPTFTNFEIIKHNLPEGQSILLETIEKESNNNQEKDEGKN